MDRLLYVAMTGAKQLMQAQALVSHNLANVSTTGFRADLARFEARPIEGPGYQSRVNTGRDGLGLRSLAGRARADGRSPRRRDRRRWLARRAGARRQRSLCARRQSKVNSLGLLETERGELVLGDNGPWPCRRTRRSPLAADGTLSIVPQGQGSETLAQIGRLKLVNPEPPARQTPRRLDRGDGWRRDRARCQRQGGFGLHRDQQRQYRLDARRHDRVSTAIRSSGTHDANGG